MRHLKAVVKRTLSVLLAFLTVVTGVYFAAPQPAAATDSTVEIVFDNPESVNYWAFPNNVSAAYNQYEQAMEIVVTTAADPYVLLNVEGGVSVSADTHKYVVVTYKVPVTNSGTESKTELFMSAGAITGPTGGYSVVWNHTKTYKYQSQIIDMSGESYWTGAVHNIRFDVFSSGAVLDYFYVSSVTFCDSASSAAAASAEQTARANKYVNDIPEAAFAGTAYLQELYLEEYWKGNVVYNESVFPLCNPDGTIPPMTLMYDVERIISVRDGTLGKVYKYGVDYTISDGKLVILPTGSIPCYPYSSYKTYTAPSDMTYWTNSADGGYINVNKMAEYHGLQLNVTYTHEDVWEGPVVSSKLELLPNTYEKLKSGERTVVVFNGDSVTYGCDASSMLNINPYMPYWADMTVASLKAEYGHTAIDYTNTAVGGTTSEWGLANVYENISKFVPDLVFLGFGTNDGSLGIDTATYKANLEGIIAAVRQVNPDCEFILVAPCVPNRDSLFAGLQADYIPVLESLEGEGVALVNMQEIHDYMIGAKKYVDMTSNNVNHPNDFFIRFYAQAMTAALTLSDTEETRAVCLASLEGYVDVSDYRAEEQAQIEAIKETAAAAITAAETEEAMLSALADAKAQIDQLKTSADYDREEIDYTKLVFSSQTVMSTVTLANGVSISLNTADRSADIASVAGDPWARISYEGAGVSADTYKYVMLVYKVPETVTNTTETQVFFATESVPYESEDFSIKFAATKGQWVYHIIGMSSMSGWSGDIRGIRIDPFASYVAGDTFKLHAVCLFETQAEAAAYGAKAVADLNDTYAGINEYTVFDNADTVELLTCEGEEFLLGDVTGEGRLNARDTQILKKYISGQLSSISPAADYNRDGRVNARDAMMVSKVIAGVVASETVSTVTADVAFDSANTSAAITSKTDGEVTVTADLSHKGVSADDFKYLGFTYLAPTGAGVTARLVSNGAVVEEAELSFTAEQGSLFKSAVLDASALSAWAGAVDGVELTITGLGEGDVLYISSMTLSENSKAAARAEFYKLNTANRLIGNGTLVTGQTVIPLNDTTSTVSYAYYNGTTGDTFTYPTNLIVTPDNQPGEKFDRFALTYTASTLTRGVIVYHVNGARVADEFFLEASSTPKTFSSLILGYFDGQMATEIESITFYPISASSSTFALKAIDTEDYADYRDTIYLQNERVKVGVLLTMGGGISHYEQLDDGNAAYGNLLNRCDEGRLIQQSYYGIDRDPYEMGLMNGQAWRYNPVQGGDVSRNPSRLVDVIVSEGSIYVKTRPMDWGHDGHLTPSYMENNYILHDNFLQVQNRFVDFSTYTHTLAPQELPAFYTVSALHTFSMYTGSAPWTGGAYTDYAGLDFWAGNHDQYYDITSGNENWFAFHDSTGFGVGLYVPGAVEIVAGRFMYDGSTSPDAPSTNYFAPLRSLTLKAGKAIEYSYLVCAGNMPDMRETFRVNKGLIDNTSLTQY